MLVRETKSLCPKCQKKIKAEIIEERQHLFMKKTCEEHGNFKLPLSSTASLYLDFENKCLPFIRQGKSKKEIEIVLTAKCNMDCPICYWGNFPNKVDMAEPSLVEIEGIIQKKIHSDWRFVLTGGEPTLRKDLPKIIQLFKKYKKEAIITTNALKLADFQYAKILKDAGLDRVNLQLDGFCDKQNKNFRLTNYNSKKLRAIENLKKLSISVGINAVVSKDTNLDQIGPLLDFAAKNEIIKSICWISLVYSGFATQYAYKNFIMADAILDAIERQSKNQIKKKDFLIFKKMLLIINTIFNKSSCRHDYTYLLIRKNKTYAPLNLYIHLDRIEPYLDKFFSVYSKNKLHGKLFVFFILPWILFLNSNSLKIFGEILTTTISFYRRDKAYLNPSQLIYLKATTCCDANNWEFNGCDCKFGVIYKSNQTIKETTLRNESLKISKGSA